MHRFNLNAALHGKVTGHRRIDAAGKHEHAFAAGTDRQPASPLVCLRAEHDAAGLDVYAHKDVRLLHLDRNARKSIQHGCPQFGIHEGCVMLVVMIGAARGYLECLSGRLHFGKQLHQNPFHFIEITRNEIDRRIVLDAEYMLQPVDNDGLVSSVQFQQHKIVLGLDFDLRMILCDHPDILRQLLDKTFFIFPFGR